MLYNVKKVSPIINSYLIKKFSTLLNPKIYSNLLKKQKKRVKTKIIRFKPNYYPRRRRKPTILIKLRRYKFSLFNKKRLRIRRKLYRRKKSRIVSLRNIFLKKNPYILIRKNYKPLFYEFFKDRLITPLSLDFLHLAYFKLNKNKLYKPRIINKLDSYAKRMYKFTLKNFKRNKLSPYQYLFTLMKKTTHYQKVFDLYNKKHLFNLELHQLFFFQKVKKYEFKRFLNCPEYINPESSYLEFNKYDALKFHEYKYIQKILGLYYPVTELHFKETHIHGKPMKTKLPRRV